MPVYQRKDTRDLFREIEKGGVYPVYLLHGERYLCQRAEDKLIAALSGEQQGKQVNVKRIEGEKEDVINIVNLLKSYTLFSGRQLIRIMDTRLLSSRINIRAYWDRALKAYAGNDRKGAGHVLLRLLDLAGLEDHRELAVLTADQWQKFFGFAKPGNLEWLNDISIDEGKSSSPQTDQDKALISFLEENRNVNNILILISEEVDKRKKLYRVIEKQGVVIDLSVSKGGNSAARKEQDSVIRELISGTMREMGKKPGPAVVDNLIERVGFHPVAAVLETEKLSLFCDDKEVVDISDVDAVVGRTREEAIYELNEAVAELDLVRSLLLADRLRERGFHSLAIIAALRKMLRKFLYIRFLQERSDPAYSPGRSYALFKKDYLDRIKSSPYGESAFLKGHPYALYSSFRQAERLSTAFLRKGLRALLKAEYRLKSSGVRDDLVMDDFFFSFLTGQEGD